MTTTELQGIAHELKFWQGFVKTPRFLNGWVAPIKTPELHQETYDFIQSVPHDTVLDVGSGVCSILNGTVPDVLTADPLGGLYELIFDYRHYNLRPPMPYPAEELPYINQFDIVHCSNALDHTQDPIKAVAKMHLAVKPGGYLILQGFENEGTFEKWEGFHKYNIYVKKENGTEYLKVANKYEHCVDLLWEPTKLYIKKLDNKDWYIWITQKQ